MQPWLTECSVVTKRPRTLWPAKLASYPGTTPCSRGSVCEDRGGNVRCGGGGCVCGGR
jgi:hypothetical protein